MGCVIDEQRYFRSRWCTRIAMAKETRLVIRTNDREHAAVLAAAKAQGKSISDLVRRGLQSQGVKL